MSHPFSNPASGKVLERVAQIFQKKTVYLLPRNELIFVCGGAPKESVRAKFLAWAEKNISDRRFFLAEAAARDLLSQNQPVFLNLGKFEKLLADLADCVLIFPESAGSFAEIGYFAAFPDIKKKCLVVNCTSKQSGSFLNDGPLDLINLSSAYRPTIFINFNEPSSFDDIRDRLAQKFDAVRRKSIEISEFDKLHGRGQLAIIFFIFLIFPSLNYASVLEICKSIFHKYNKERIAHILSLMVATEYVFRDSSDHNLLLANRTKPTLLEIDGVDANALLAEHTHYYTVHAPGFLKHN